MLKYLDNILNKITMYRVVLYNLIFILTGAIGLSIFNLLPFTIMEILISTTYITAVCFFVNFIFAWLYKAPSNFESVYITALILVLIISPTSPLENIKLLTSVSILAMTSKYILAFHLKHIFNPAAFAVVFTAYAINQPASWWIGTLNMMPFVIIGGLLIVRKIKKFPMVIAFLTTAVVAGLYTYFSNGAEIIYSIISIFTKTPLLFFSFVMLTEPMTTPPKKWQQIIYGALVGLLFSSTVHVGNFYFTPETALLIGNIYNFIVSYKRKLILELKEKKMVGNNIYDFVFSTTYKLNFEAGQYMEWTLEHSPQDNRGIRRFFTIASSPTEKDVRIGVKFYPQPSSFKSNLQDFKPGDKIIASQVSGDFVLPKDKNIKLVFIAGGIGVTPFRSIIKYLIDLKEKRDITFFYSNNEEEDVAYKEIFEEAKNKIDLKIFYGLTEIKNISPNWNGLIGYIDEETIRKNVADYKNCTFYISGPHHMITSFEKVLKKLGVKKCRIKTDFFPGFA